MISKVSYNTDIVCVESFSYSLKKKIISTRNLCQFVVFHNTSTYQGIHALIDLTENDSSDFILPSIFPGSFRRSMKADEF